MCFVLAVLGFVAPSASGVSHQRKVDRLKTHRRFSRPLVRIKLPAPGNVALAQFAIRVTWRHAKRPVLLPKFTLQRGTSVAKNLGVVAGVKPLKQVGRFLVRVIVVSRKAMATASRAHAAQDFGFVAVSRDVTAGGTRIGNRGVTGASNLAGAVSFLDTGISGTSLNISGSPAGNVCDVAVGDFNADGVSDIVLIPGLSEPQVFEGGSGAFCPPGGPLSTSTQSLLVGLGDGAFGSPSPPPPWSLETPSGTWHHNGPGDSTLHTCAKTDPARGAPYTLTITRPDNSTVNQTGNLDSSGNADIQTPINAYGNYTQSLSVTYGGTTKTTSTTTNVTSTQMPGTCP